MTPIPKPTRQPSARKAAQAKLARAEAQKVRTRSQGRCEVTVRLSVAPDAWMGMRCPMQARAVHHMIGGRGMRNVGRSALAKHQQHVCMQCHRDITGGIGGRRLVLRPAGPVPVWTDQYERVR